MASGLQHMLRRFCSGTEWKYAVFWKLKRRSHMDLTLGDAYYDINGHSASSEAACSTESMQDFYSLSYSHDPLGLALAKMSYYVYPLGEGIIGQLAITGKHHWIFADDYNLSSCPSDQDYDLWQTQFLAGIRTVVVVAVVPYGVLQLGSLQKVNVDLTLVTHFRDALQSTQDSFMQHQLTHTPCCLDDLLYLSDLPYPEEYICGELSNICSSASSILKHVNKSCVEEHWDFQPKDAAEVYNKNGELKNSKSCQISKPHEAKLDILNLENKKLVNEELPDETPLTGETSCLDYVSSLSENVGFSDATLPDEAFGVTFTCMPSANLNSAASKKDQSNGLDTKQGASLAISESSMQQKDLMEKLDADGELNGTDRSASLRFSTISELHEALGPVFQIKSTLNGLEEQKTEARSIEMFVQVSNSQLTNESCGEHLLEAIVAKVGHSCHDDFNEKLFSTSVEYPVNCQRMSKSSTHPAYTFKPVGYSMEQHSNMEEDSRFVMSSPGISSTFPSSVVELLGSSANPVKSSRRRARPGESRRPRPRDRQLIQDRLKELRELVPNKSKCSIDSLLEHTVKHLLFLESITKHAEKLNRCIESKSRHHRETSAVGSSNYDQGSSWAVEVGSQLKVLSIVVENLSKNGQLLVEMLCEDGGVFLEIVEAMRNLGLTILKGATEPQGEKIWICFIVEGEDSNNVCRMDILWSLVRILQPKTSSET